MRYIILSHDEPTIPEYARDDPLDYVLHTVYPENNIDPFSLAESRQDNELTMEIINDNDKYPTDARTTLQMGLGSYENMNLLDELGLDTNHMPNYEPVFLNTLQMIHEKEYKSEISKRIELYGDEVYDPVAVFKKMVGTNAFTSPNWWLIKQFQQGFGTWE